MFYGIINWNCIVTNERNVLKMREYGEEKAKRELEELLQIIPIKIKNQDFINDVNENIKNQEYRMALEKVRRFLDEKEDEQVEIKPTEIEELDPDKIITETKKEAEESLYPEKLRNYALEKQDWQLSHFGKKTN